jgi:hypothetical protein
MKKPGKVAAMLSSAFVFLSTGCRSGAAEVVREPAHAGVFYPAGKAELAAILADVLAKAAVADATAGRVPKAVVVPHAGYQFSAATAAWAYKALAPGAKTMTRVILLAPSHYVGFMGALVNGRAYRTPLGVCHLDAEAVAKLKSLSFPQSDAPGAGTREHSDEVQVPFIQTALPNAKLVPLIIGELMPGDADTIARALSAIIDDHTVIVTSSDFTHYGDRFGYTPDVGPDAAAGIRKIDMGAAELIARGDADGFGRYIDRTGATICGRNPIAVLLAVFKANGWKADGKVLNYTTSGAETGDYANSVSYCAIALGDITVAAVAPAAGAAAAGAGDGSGAAATESSLTPAEGQKLVQLARHVLERFVRDRVTEFPDTELAKFGLTDATKGRFGVFVTLRERSDLRGCIGHIIPRLPLYRGVIENAMNAAARDPRFRPVEPGELSAISIEISVMSPLIRVGSLDEIKVGRDGLVLVCGPNSGVFLPQVPGEQGWDKTMYLEQLGRKAGLDTDAYRRKETELHRFTAQIFEENP